MNVYGYNHPPRAARDVREQGIPLETFRVKSSDGRTIAAYRFGDVSRIRAGRLGGRQVFPRQLKIDLYELARDRCMICAGVFAARYLQVDHCIPYEISGDDEHFQRDVEDYMLLCSTCNRAKSWSCENCPNWEEKAIGTCQVCYWASPSNYTHVATRKIRRTDILWDEDELFLYDIVANMIS